MKSFESDAETVDWTGYEVAGNRYQITHKMGEGGMASVYHACDRRLRTEVVIKVPHSRMLAIPEFAARFTREVRAMLEVSHPHVVRVLDVGVHEDLPFAILQYLPSGSLEDRLRPEGVFESKGVQDDSGWSPAELNLVPDWITKIASALDYLHSKGLIHRDVKPGNIMFDETGNPFLSDFGIVKVLGDLSSTPDSECLTTFGSVLGTIRFMAPEVLAGLNYDGRADQFALAVSAYLAWSGKYPFQGNSPVTMLYQQSLGGARPIHEVRRELTPAVSEVLARALAREPNARYKTCGEFAAELITAARPQPQRSTGAALLSTQPILTRIAVRMTPRKLRRELRLMLLAHGAQIERENDDDVVAHLPMRQSWLQRWWEPARRIVLTATCIRDDRDPQLVQEVVLSIAGAGRPLTAEERQACQNLLTDAHELLASEESPTKAETVAVSNSTQSRAADVVDVNFVGQDLGYVCRVAKASSQGAWLIAGSAIEHGVVDITFSPQAPKQRGRIVKTVKRSDGTFALGVAFAEPIELPPKLKKLLDLR
jgi:serine/threonine protein kinase